MALRTWREFAYLLVGAVVATGMFYILFLLLVVGAVLAIFFVGIPLLAVAVLGARRAGGVWRWLSRTMLRTTVPSPPPRVPRPGVLGFIGSGLSDVPGWRAVVFLLVRFPLGLLGACGCVLLWGVALSALLSPVVRLLIDPTVTDLHGVVHHAVTQFGTFYAETWPTVLATSLVGLLLCFLAPWPVRWLAALDRRLVRALLGPTARDARVAELERTRSRAVEDSADRLRRLERDLHDGTQAKLVTMAMNVSRAGAKIEDDPEGARVLLDATRGTAEDALVELREIVRSIHPPALDRGLDAALATLTARSAVPARLDTRLDRRVSRAVETIAYFCIAELLANVARHADATLVNVDAWTTSDELRLLVRDDGRGGARPGAGSGLVGLGNRVASVDGTLCVDSPAGGPTSVTITLPLTTSGNANASLDRG